MTKKWVDHGQINSYIKLTQTDTKFGTIIWNPLFQASYKNAIALVLLFNNNGYYVCKVYIFKDSLNS